MPQAFLQWLVKVPLGTCFVTTVVSVHVTFNLTNRSVTLFQRSRFRVRSRLEDAVCLFFYSRNGKKTECVLQPKTYLLVCLHNLRGFDGIQTLRNIYEWSTNQVRSIYVTIK